MPDAGVFYIEETGKTYQYEHQMNGTLPNSTVPISFYVYSNDPDLTFSELLQILVSSQQTEKDLYISEVKIPEKS